MKLRHAKYIAMILVAISPLTAAADTRECAKFFSKSENVRSWTERIDRLTTDLGRVGMETSDRNSYHETEIAVLLLAKVLSSGTRCLVTSSISEKSIPIDKPSAEYISSVTKSTYQSCYEATVFVRSRLQDSVAHSSDTRVKRVLAQALDLVTDVKSQLEVCNVR